MAGLVALLVFVGRQPGGARGLVLCGAIGVLFSFGSWCLSDRIALPVRRAQPADPSRDAGPLAIVRGLATRAALPMPRVSIIPSTTPNALAAGRSPGHLAVAVTRGILRVLNRPGCAACGRRSRRSRGAGHADQRDRRRHRRPRGSGGAAVGWGAMFGGHGRGSDDGERGVARSMMVLAIVAPLVAMRVQLAISRSRKYAADDAGAQLSGDPDALANALLKLEAGVEHVPYEHAGPATAHLFIVNPFSGRALASLLSTHPSTEERVARLRAM